MNKNFKPNERELIKVATFFKKKSQELIAQGKLGEENRNVAGAVDRFIEHMNQHADARAFILEQREFLKKLVKDNPRCPECHSAEMLKLVGTEKNDRGWTSNRYKCRKCNILFTWNLPNNPWDMISYIEDVLGTLKGKISDDTAPDDERAAIGAMEANLAKLKPVIEAHDNEFHQLESREAEMEKLVHEFKNSLLIEKIKLDSWENK